MDEGKSVRSRRVGSGRGVCGVARLARGIDHGLRRAPCIRSLAEANAAHAEYSDRLLWRNCSAMGGCARHRLSAGAYLT